MEPLLPSSEPKTMKVKIVRRCVVGTDQIAQIGDIVELPTMDAKYLKAIKKAVDPDVPLPGDETLAARKKVAK